MSVIATFIFPHPPVIMPQIGRGEEKKIQKTIDSYKKACKTIALLKPDTIVLVSSHCATYSDYIYISPGETAWGDLSKFGGASVSVQAEYDSVFIDRLSQSAFERNVPAGTMGHEDPNMDHASVIPLAFLNEVYTDYKLVRIGISQLPFSEHYKLGMCVEQTSKALNRRTVLIASGDLSHKLSASGPYGYSKQGEQFDNMVKKAIKKADFSVFMEFSQEFLEQVAECGLRTFIIMAGALDKKDVKSQLLSYEKTFGVGYAVASFIIKGENKSRNYLGNDNFMRIDEGQDEYAALARYSVEYYVKNGDKAEVPSNISKKLLNDRAGVFVTLKKNGNLRGCIGTISPVRNSVVEEIIRNSVSACSEDPRFPAVTQEELAGLEYSVDVLQPSEKISSKEQLDVERYGVIVSLDFRLGILLPNLEWVNSVEEQVAIALQKAGIEKDEDYLLERFEVVRYK